MFPSPTKRKNSKQDDMLKPSPTLFNVEGGASIPAHLLRESEFAVVNS